MPSSLEQKISGFKLGRPKRTVFQWLATTTKKAMLLAGPMTRRWAMQTLMPYTEYNKDLILIFFLKFVQINKIVLIKTIQQNSTKKLLGQLSVPVPHNEWSLIET